jgi:hypothetical protein
MMINNSTNINKARHHLSPQFIEHKFKKKVQHIALETWLVTIWQGKPGY